MGKKDTNEKKDGLTIAEIKRVQALARRRRELMALPAEEALSRILESPQPEPLVHSYPAEDLYYLIHEIGPADALPVLAMASDNQLDHILDMETWEKDCLDVAKVEDWIALTLKADKGRATRWLVEKQPDLLVYYFFKTAQIVIRNHDEDPSDFGEGFLSMDDTFYLRPKALSPDESPEILEDRQVFLSELLHRISSFDYIAYQKILLETESVIPAEYEEDAYRWRNVRLAEKGFLPWEESMEVYRPLSMAEMAGRRLPQQKSAASADDFLPVPQYVSDALSSKYLFVEALKDPENRSIQDRLQIEFASLNNQLITADHLVVKERDALKTVVNKTCGILSIGLEILAENSEMKNRLAAAVKNLQQYRLADIFRMGFGEVLALKKRAQRWQKESWFQRQGLRLTFWGEQWVGVIGGLLIETPMYFDNYQTGALYREFSSISEIRLTADVLDRIIAVDSLLSLLPALAPDPFSAYGPMDYKNYLLTGWARHDLNLTEAFRPLSMGEFKTFFNTLWTDEAMPRTISESARELFLSWMSVQSGADVQQLQESLGSVLESIFIEMENEYGRIRTDDLDPRYIHLFLIQK